MVSNNNYYPDTTISIKPDNLIRLNNACQRLGVSKIRLLSILLRSTLHEFTHQIEPVGHIRYQKTTEKTVIIHIALPEQDYEQDQDLRRFTKFSVSFIIGFAIENLLDIITKESLSFIKKAIAGDSYRHNYSISVKSEKNSVHFFVQWGESVPLKNLISYRS